MSIPDLIIIPYETVPPFNRLGTYADGLQFLGLCVADKPQSSTTEIWYALLHKFDKNGNYLETSSWSGDKDDVENNSNCAIAKLENLIEGLSPVENCDIKVRPFATTVGGLQCGLLVESSGHEWANLLEVDISFYPPWDGRYDT